MQLLDDSWTLISTLRDDRDKRRLVLPYVWYLAAVGLVLLAGRADIAVLQHLQEMSETSRMALRLTATGLIEAMEAQFLTSELERASQAEQGAEQMSKESWQKAKVDEWYADRDRKRAEYFNNFANREYNFSRLYNQRLQQDETERLELLQNISRDEKEEAKLQEELEEVHSGRLCNGTILSPICSIVGGATELQRRADQESLMLQQEYQAQQTLNRQEFLDKIVALSYTGKAQQYEKMATDLFTAAHYWENKSKEDTLQAIKANETVRAWKSGMEQLQEEEKKEEEWEVKNLSHAEQQWILAEQAYLRAVRHAIFGCFVALAAVFFFTSQAIPATIEQAQQFQQWFYLNNTSDTFQDIEFWRCISYTCAHLFIFLICVGTGPVVGNYLGTNTLYYYAWDQRAAIFTWFSFVAATIQTLALHTIPHILSEWPTLQNTNLSFNNSTVMIIAKQSLFRLISLMCLFTLELLFLWVNFGGRWLFSPAARSVFGSFPCWVITLFLLAMHVTLFEPRGTKVLYSSSPSVSQRSRVGGGTAERLLFPTEPLTSLLLQQQQGSNAPPTQSIHVSSRPSVSPSELTPLSCFNGNEDNHNNDNYHDDYKNTNNDNKQTATKFVNSGPTATGVAFFGFVSSRPVEDVGWTAQSGDGQQQQPQTPPQQQQQQQQQQLHLQQQQQPFQDYNGVVSPVVIDGYGDGSANTTTTVASCSPYYCILQMELAKLLLPLHIFFLSCMASVLIDCIPLTEHYLMAKIGIVCFVFLLVVMGVVVRMSLYGKYNQQKLTAQSSSQPPSSLTLWSWLCSSSSSAIMNYTPKPRRGGGFERGGGTVGTSFSGQRARPSEQHGLIEIVSV